MIGHSARFVEALKDTGVAGKNIFLNPQFVPSQLVPYLLLKKRVTHSFHLQNLYILTGDFYYDRDL